MSTSNCPIVNSASNSDSNACQPSLPPLYFENEPESTLAVDSSTPLCSELETTVLSFLTWGDFARLAAVNSSLSNIVQDAAAQSTEAKFTLAQSLLKGQHGLEANAALAIQHLLDLAGVQVDPEQFDPSYEEIESSEIQNQNNHQIQPENDDDEDIERDPSASGQAAIAAMRQLASCYLNGHGVEPDQNKGLAWLQQAYRHGDLDCAHETAVIYEYGKYGVDTNPNLAASWFLGAAKAGHVESMAEYAMCLELGCGVEQSDEEALDWYQRAANLGHVQANYSVGEWFESARGGLPQSDTEAVLWYFKAASMGDEDSKAALKRLSDIARIVVPGWASTLNV